MTPGRTLGVCSAVCLLSLAAAAATTAGQRAAPPEVPQYAEAVHVGPTTCAGSSCHGTSQAWQRLQGSDVAQNEHRIWRREDPHAGAYQTLRSARSQRIAENLGLEDAHTADVCLDCHADNVPSGRRERTFQLSAGVGCEACHGGARRWMSAHVTNNDRAANLRAGMYPTDDPVARAQLCLSCHLGEARKMVTHRIMGAGHPRLSFELDTFTAIQPAHFVVDADYKRRKGWAGQGRTWAIGQLVATSQTLAALRDPAVRHDGLFPELTFYDCHACHHPQEELRYAARPSVPTGPGRPRLNDAGLLMVRVIVDVLGPEHADGLQGAHRDLHAASETSWEGVSDAALRIESVCAAVLEGLRDAPLSDATLWALGQRLVSLGQEGEYQDYAGAEQAAMALGAVLADLIAREAVSAAEADALRAALDGCYAAVDDEAAWDAAAFRQALAALGEALREAGP